MPMASGCRFCPPKRRAEAMLNRVTFDNAAPVAVAEVWRGHGIEVGTNDSVTIEGSSPDDVRAQALGRAYAVRLNTIWRAS